MHCPVCNDEILDTVKLDPVASPQIPTSRSGAFQTPPPAWSLTIKAAGPGTHLPQQSRKRATWMQPLTHHHHRPNSYCITYRIHQHVVVSGWLLLHATCNSPGLLPPFASKATETDVSSGELLLCAQIEAEHRAGPFNPSCVLLTVIALLRIATMPGGGGGGGIREGFCNQHTNIPTYQRYHGTWYMVSKTRDPQTCRWVKGVVLVRPASQWLVMLHLLYGMQTRHLAWQGCYLAWSASCFSSLVHVT